LHCPAFFYPSLFGWFRATEVYSGIGAGVVMESITQVKLSTGNNGQLSSHSHSTAPVLDFVRERRSPARFVCLAIADDVAKFFADVGRRNTSPGRKISAHQNPTASSLLLGDVQCARPQHHAMLVLSSSELTRINACNEVLMQGRRTRRIILLLTFVLQVSRLRAQVESEQVLEMPYRVVPNFLKLPSDLYFSEVFWRSAELERAHFCFPAGITSIGRV
jgi:hypothetical protein